jgi:hypothetical protein
MQRVLEPGPDATARLSALIRQSEPGDTIAVPTESLRKLGEIAASRMGVEVAFVLSAG